MPGTPPQWNGAGQIAPVTLYFTTSNQPRDEGT
jgi:hypothetical protein